MQTTESLNRRIASTEDLQGVVRTMKVIAAVSIRQYEKAVESLSEYNRTVEMGLQILLKNRPEIVPAKPDLDQRLGAIIFGSDQGMCGQFNEQISSYAITQLDNLKTKSGERLIMAVGARVIPHLEEAGLQVEEYFSIPGSIAAITTKVQDMVLKIEQWRSQGQVERILIFYNKPISGSSYRPHSLHLFPLDPGWFRNLIKKDWPSRVLPTFTMDWQRLFHVLIREYFFVSLYRAFAESLTSENASRLASMQGAESNIEDRLKELKMQYNQLRQSSITEELLDIVAGFTALTSK